jgi:enamine deaminase RidA (YjgF/YER057c/UK114 family)
MIQVARRFYAFLSCLLVGAFTAGIHAQNDSFKVIKIDSVNPGGVSATGVLSNGTLYIAGQGGLNSDGSVPKDFQQEVAQSMRNVQKVLQAADMDYGNAVWMNIFVTSGASFTARELRSRGSGASLDVREGSMPAMTLLPGA